MIAAPVQTSDRSMRLPVLADGYLTTHSSESAFRRCPRFYELAYVRALRPVATKNPLRIGSAFHKGLEALKAGGTEEAAAATVRGMYADAGCPPWMEVDEFACEREKIVGMVVAWGRRWSGDQMLKTVACEISFDLPILNPVSGIPHRTYRNAGVIDWITETPDGKLALCDHKSCAEDISPGSPFWLKLLMDHQLSRYWLAARDIGYDVQTAVIDATRKPAIKPKAVAKADRAMATANQSYCGLPLAGVCPERESPLMYGARVLKTMLDEPSYYFARMAVARLDSDLEQFRRDQWATLKMIAACEDDGHYPRSTGACTSFGTSCQYLDLCRGLRGNPDEQIPDGFAVVDRVHGELTRTPADEPAGEE